MSQSICSTGLRWLWLVVVVLIIDLGSKYLILQNFALGDTVPLFPSLNLHYARNYGAAFSFLADSGGWQRWFFAGIAIGISVILAVMMYRSKATQKLNNIAYALIIGGALGNLFDRLWHGFVVDMIDFYVGDWHFATFNLADTAICVGAALIVLEGFLPSKAKKTIINPAGCDADASYPAYRLLRNRRPDKAFTPHPAKILKYKSKPACLNLYRAIAPSWCTSR
ncbi:lipoprotein signal peptidase [Escherichia coli]|nr:lipoprotein signal peptidase [Escherichia coli]VFT00917.1 lipoprotein signal peptidase [Escherichia coli]